MPTMTDGTRAEIILNGLGVINRLNPAQMQEIHINFMSDHVVKLMKEKETLEDQIDLYLSYLKELNKDQHSFTESELLMMNRSQKEEFVEDILREGIFIHQTPFFKNTSEEDFIKINREHPEWITRYKCEGIERPLIIGDMYFVRLKHESSNKASMLSADTTNNKGLPSKSNSKKLHKTLFANTPIRLGEMEVANLHLTKRGDIVAKMLKAYATSQTDRQELIKKLLLSPNPTNIDVELSEGKSINRQILDKYFDVLELSIEDDVIKEDEE